MNQTLKEHSHNIITKDNLPSKLGDKSIDIRTKQDIITAITLYLKHIVGQNLKYKVSHPLRILGGLNSLAIYKESSFGWLSNLENETLVVRTNAGLRSNINNCIIEMINNMLPSNIEPLVFNEILGTMNTLIPGASEEELNSILRGTIPNYQYQDASKPYILNSKFKEIYNIFSKLANTISDTIGLNIMFLFTKVPVGELSSLDNVIVSGLNPDQNTLAINIIIHSAHQFSYKKDISVDKIIFEYMYELDYKNNRLNNLIGESITNQIIKEQEPKLRTHIFDRTLETDMEISFEPFDKQIELDVIKIFFKDGIDRNFLLGSTGNLYEDDDNNNDLVGKIKDFDKSTNSAEIYWCKNFYEKINK